MKNKTYRMGLLFALLALAIAACSGPNRAASTPVDVPGQQPAGQTEQPQDQATDAPSQVETLMAGELATQTAIASGAQPDAPEATEAPPEPTATAIPDENNAPDADPTDVPPEPTAEPTDEPDPDPVTDCSSPYTVQKGDWVWDIGRRCNIHPNSIIAANNLVYPYTVFPGDVLILPSNAPPFPGP